MRATVEISARVATAMFAIMSLPLLSALTTGDLEQHQNIVALMIVGLFISVATVAAVEGQTQLQTRGQQALCVIIAWVVMAIVGALPFVVTGLLSPAQAIFESVSGLTTNGASLFDNRAGLSTPVILWRAGLEWIGGLGALVTLIYFLIPTQIGGQQRGRTLFGGRPQQLAAVYLIFSLVIFFLFSMTGVSAQQAMHLAIISVSTGGFLPFEGDIRDLFGTATILLFSVLLLLSSVSLVWISARGYQVRRDFRAIRSECLYVAIAGLTLCVLFMLVIRYISSRSDPLIIFSDSLFSAASLVSTVGLEPQSGFFSIVPDVLVLAVVLVGAGALSTSGGLRVFRLFALVMHFRRELRALIYPNSVAGTQFVRTEIHPVWVMFLAAILIILFAMLSLSALGLGFEAAFACAIALFSGAGPVYSSMQPIAGEVDGWLNLSSLGAPALLVCAVVMLLGRLEVLVVFSVINVGYWRRR